MVNSNLIKREFFLSLYLSLPYFLTTTCHLAERSSGNADLVRCTSWGVRVSC